jgi:ComEC/Rec2-related protein
VKPGYPSIAIISILLLIASISIYKYSKGLAIVPVGVPVQITGVISVEPVYYDRVQQFILHGYRITTPLYPRVSYGDSVVVSGVVGEYHGRATLEKATIKTYDKSDSFLYRIRANLLNFYKSNIPDPHSALISGVTIGSKELISPDFWENLKTSGTAHVVVASGMNVTLLTKFFITMFLSVMARKWAIVLTGICIWGYTMIVGFDAPIVRATVMCSLVFLAALFGRGTRPLYVLILTSVLLLIVRPDWFYDVGFYLSVAATAALVLFEKPISEKLSRVPKIIRADLSTSLAAQIGVAPIQWIFFGNINIFAPLINALVLWTIVPTTIIGLIDGMASLVYEPVGTLLLYASYPFTSWFVFIVRLTN